MGANDQETTVRITAEDNTGKAVTSIGARFYSLHKEAQAMFRGYADGALVSTKSIEDFAKKNKVTFDQAFAQMEKLRDARIKADQARADAADKADKSNNAQKASAKGIAGELAGMAARYLSVAAAIDIVRRSFLGFADFDKKMRLIQNGTDATKEQMKEFSAVIKQVSAETGASLDDVGEAFKVLQETANLSLAETQKILPELAVQADGMGVSVTDLGRLMGEMMRNFNIPAKDASRTMEIISHGARKLKLNVNDLGPVISGLTNSMSEWGYAGAEGAARMVAMLGVARDATGDSSKAAQVLSNIFEKLGSGQLAEALGKNPQMLYKQLKEIQAAGGDVMGAIIAMMDKATDQRKVAEAIGVRDIKVVRELSRQWGGMTDKITEAKNAQGGYAAGLNTLNSAQGRVNQLMNSLVALMNSLGALLDALGATTALKFLADQIMGAVKGMERLTELWKWITGQEIKKPEWVPESGAEFSHRLLGERKGWFGSGELVRPWDREKNAPGMTTEEKEAEKKRIDAMSPQEKALYERGLQRQRELNKQIETTTGNIKKMSFALPDTPGFKVWKTALGVPQGGGGQNYGGAPSYGGSGDAQVLPASYSPGGGLVHRASYGGAGGDGTPIGNAFSRANAMGAGTRNIVDFAAARARRASYGGSADARTLDADYHPGEGGYLGGPGGGVGPGYGGHGASGPGIPGMERAGPGGYGSSYGGGSQPGMTRQGSSAPGAGGERTHASLPPPSGPQSPTEPSGAVDEHGHAHTGVGGYNFMGSERARRMGYDIKHGSREAQMPFATGIPKDAYKGRLSTIRANKYAGPDMAGFLKDLHEAGAPLDQFAGAYVNKPRQHGYGNALDIETGFGSGPDNSPKLYAWAQKNPELFKKIQAQHHMRNLDPSSGATVKDWGHFEWTPTGRAPVGETQTANAPQAGPQAPAAGGTASGDFKGNRVNQDVLKTRIQQSNSEWMKDPKNQQKIYRALQAEGGMSNIGANLEQMSNYAASRGKSLQQVVEARGTKQFYGPLRRFHGDPGAGQMMPHEREAFNSPWTPQKQAAWDKASKEVFSGGSNRINYATDQGTVGDPNYNPNTMTKYGGNMFGVQPGTGKWVSAQRGKPQVEGPVTAVAEAPKTETPATTQTAEAGQDNTPLGRAFAASQRSRTRGITRDPVHDAQMERHREETEALKKKDAAAPAEEPSIPERAKNEVEKPLQMNVKVNQNDVQFARSSMKRQADREVREARWSSYSDIGAA